MQATVERTNGRPSDELRRADARRSGGCGGGCGGHRHQHPQRHQPRTFAQWFVDTATFAVGRKANQARNLFYMVESFCRAWRLGIIDHELYHLRRLHCDDCERRKLDDKTGLEFCSADACGCGKTKRACLTSKLRLAGWQCPEERFGVRHQVAAPHEHRKVET